MYIQDILVLLSKYGAINFPEIHIYNWQIERLIRVWSCEADKVTEDVCQTKTDQHNCDFEYLIICFDHLIIPNVFKN